MPCSSSVPEPRLVDRSGCSAPTAWRGFSIIGRACLLLAIILGTGALPLRGAVMISEFLASNDGGLRDDDGDESDWIEIFNSGPTEVSLAGWSLSDNSGTKAKWVFPAVALPPNGFLVVWASGKDRRNPAAPLHTNFSLGRTGGYLGLFDQAGTSVTEYASYPEQYENRPYGVR
ncbi:MAG: lamin tail domain-containing protein, partial [Verrucomicrobiaceae bacterium]